MHCCTIRKTIITYIQYDLYLNFMHQHRSSSTARRRSSSTRHRQAPTHVYSTVVRIIVHRLFFDYTAPYSVSALNDSFGSGFFIDCDGHILTCAHVIDDATEVEVEIATQGRRRFKAHVLGICPEFDLGMLRIEGFRNTEWCALDTDNRVGVKTGDTVAVVGYPLGHTNLKQTKGVLSGQQRNRYQTDAPINAGNSGGPMFKNGIVIGVNDSKYTGHDVSNIGFAIPIARYALVAKQLQQPKHIVHFPTSFGVSYQYTYPEWMDYTGCTCNKTFIPRRSRRQRKRTTKSVHASSSSLLCGVYITRVFRDGLLSSTRIRKGDVLCAVDGMPVDAYGELPRRWMNQQMTLSNLLCTLPLGRRVPVTYWSRTKNKLIHTSFTMKERPLHVRNVYPTFEQVDYEVFGGMVVMPLVRNHVTLYWNQNSNYTAPQLRKYLKPDECHQPKLVMSVLTGSFLAGLQILDNEPHVLKTVNQRTVSTLSTFREAIKHPVQKHGRAYVEVCTEDDVMVVLPMDVITVEVSKLQRVHKF